MWYTKDREYLGGGRMEERYNNYHKHSHRSNVYTVDTHIRNEDYCKRAVELGHTTLFSTEHGYGRLNI